MFAELDCRVGLAGGTALRSVDEVRADIGWADDAGFDSYWISHIFGVDPLVALASAASAGPGLAELGTSVMPTAGRHPIALAQQARTAQQACGGRLTLGIGPSHQIVVEAVFGESWDPPVERTGEYLSALLPLLNGEAAAFTGEHVHAHATLDVPAEPVPVLLAALGPRMLALAGGLGIGTHLGNCGPRTIAEHIVPSLASAAEAAGHTPPRVVALVSVCVTDDRVAALDHARQAGAGYAALPSYRAMLDREGVESPAELMLAGSVGQIIDGLQEYVDAGVTDLRLALAGPTEAIRQKTRDAVAAAMA